MCFYATVKDTDELYNRMNKNKSGVKHFYKIVTGNRRSPYRGSGVLYYGKGDTLVGKDRYGSTRRKRVRRGGGQAKMSSGIYVHVTYKSAVINKSYGDIIIKVSAHKDDLIGSYEYHHNDYTHVACFKKVKVLT